MSSRGFLSLLTPPHHASILNFTKSNDSHTYARCARKSNHSHTYAKTGGYTPSLWSDHACRSARYAIPERKSFIYVSLAPRALARGRQLAEVNSFIYVSLAPRAFARCRKNTRDKSFPCVCYAKGAGTLALFGPRNTGHGAPCAARQRGRVLAIPESGAPRFR
jgi:hypothetical protein